MIDVANTILVFKTILVIGLLVFIHELGHFLLAKWCGVGVVKFAVGFGPALVRFRIKETIYQIGIIPLGGFVRMVGDMPDMLTGEQETDDSLRSEEEESEFEVEDNPHLLRALQDRNRWFIEKNYWQRSAIVVAGPFFNFLLCIVLAGMAGFIYGLPMESPPAQIGGILENSPAEKAGLEADDTVLSVDGVAVDSWVSMAKIIHAGTGEPIQLAVQRGQQELSVSATPVEQDWRGPDGKDIKMYVIGIEPPTEKLGLLAATKYGVLWTIDKTVLTYQGLWGMMSGQVSANEIAGPIFIFQVTKQQAKAGFKKLLYFTAILSISLAVLNLLPIPILDGGHLLLFTIEALSGPISIRKKEYAQQFGLLLLLGLMIFAVHNDITRDPIDMGGGNSISFDEKPADGSATQDADSHTAESKGRNSSTTEPKEAAQ